MMSIFSANYILNKNQTEGGRLEHIALLSLLKEARLAFLKSHQMTEDCIVPGIGFVIGDLSVRYIAAAYAGDNVKVLLNISEVSEKRCTLLYQVTKESKNELIAAAKTTIIFFDIAANKSAKIPTKFLEITGVIQGNQEAAENSKKVSRL